jgi:hypothetical protein
MDNYNKLTLLQLKILKSKEKDNIKKQNIIKAINKIVKTSQLKWSPNNLLINNKNKEDSDSSDITISTLSTDSSDSSNLNNKSKIKNNNNVFTNYDITKYYNKVSNKKDDNDKLFTRMMNFADCVKTKKPLDIYKPYKENNKKKILGKRKYIN